LDFIDDHPPSEGFERAHGVILKPAAVQEVLQVEPVDVGTAKIVSCEGGFAALAGAEDESDGPLIESLFYALEQLTAFILHACKLGVEVLMCKR